MSAKRNVIANFAGRAWSALMALAFLPLYIRFLGIEAYGLIGAFVALMAILSVFDAGLSTTLTRELARLPARPGSEREARDLLRTFEAIYWGVGLLLGALVALLAPFLAREWLGATVLPVRAVEQATMLMGLVLALQWPNALYGGGLLGLQRHALLNVIRAGAATLQAGGAVLVLWLVSPTIQAYFLWQVMVAALHTALVAVALWRSLPGAPGASFSKSLLAGRWRFAGGIAGITVLVVLLSQTDKVMLSRMLSLEAFGYYALATVVAGSLNYISGPIYSALFPSLIQAVGRGDADQLSAMYHKGSQLMAVLVVPVWIVLALFSRELLTLWLADDAAVAGTYLLVSLLGCGTALNALMTLPYALQLAYGWTALSLYKNAVSLLVAVPLLFWVIGQYGAPGAAAVWVALNAGYLLFEIPLMHRRLLRGGMARWYLVDVGLPVGICLLIGVAARLAMPVGMPAAAILLWILSVLALCFLSVALALPHTRAWVRHEVARRGRLGTA